MRATLDLPDDLVRQLKLRAARDGRDVQDVAAGLLAAALAGPGAGDDAGQPVPKHLPLIKGHSAARPTPRHSPRSRCATSSRRSSSNTRWSGLKELLDTNTWIALALETHPHHAAARRWYEAAPLTRGDLLFCRATEISFLRLITQGGCFYVYAF